MYLRFTIIAFLILLSLGTLLIATKNTEHSNIIPVFDLSEAIEKYKSIQAHEIRIRGFVKPGSVLRYA